MSGAAQLIAELRTLGGALSVNGDRLRIVTDNPLPEEMLSRLKAAKPELLEAVRRGRRWDAQGWRDYFDERAAIIEHDGGMMPADAEVVALQHCVVKWLALNPPADNGENACCHCGAFAGPDALVILAGDGNLHRVIHGRCHAPMLEARRGEALAAMNAALSQTKGQ